MLPRALLTGLGLLAASFLAAQALAGVRFEHAFAALFAFAVFLFVFVRADAGLYLVLFSMLLSPEFVVGGAGELAEGRRVVLRLEDLLLIAITLSWLARMAVNKELGLVVRTPLNRWIVLYVASTLAATLTGYLTGTVKTAAGFFYVLKYVEFFVVYYMTVNNLRDRPHARRLVVAAFITAALVSLIAAAQIPTGERVSAPFEGETGEPNTLGGYLLLMIALAGGVALETTRLRVRAAALTLLGLMVVPFLYTLSRASYLGVIPMVVVLALLSSHRRLMGAALLVLVLAAPLVLPALAPAPVARRVLYTFEPEQGQPTVRIGGVAFDPSTSERLLAFRKAVEGWLSRPLLGYGVTGFRFMDAQYARTLVETGLVGFAAFLALLVAVLRGGLASFRALRDPEDRGLALGFVAGTVGLAVHAVGSNTFIIVRIMEPFWFFAGVVVLLPHLRDAPGLEPALRPAAATT
ncbi:MAG TPA: O-antigen ligase family protein [Candidatus Binatia bacterium]|nr:O-antigen ligase family protein [Candidatus Binatia bacterium]